MTLPERPAIPWIVWQHLDDAAHLRSVRALLLRAPHVKLRDIDRADERLSAHLDGLFIAGAAGSLLSRSALEVPGVGQIFVSLVLAVEQRDMPQIDRLLSLLDVVPDAARSLPSAFGWVAPASLRGLAPQLLAASSPSARWLGVAACALHRVDPGAALAQALAQPHEGLAARAMRAAGELGRVDLLPACLDRLQDGAPALSWAATRAALLLGDRSAAGVTSFGTSFGVRSCLLPSYQVRCPPMSRPLRIEFPGAIYHVTSRGDRREPIFVDDEDRETMIAVWAQGMDRFDAQALAYCLMGNHYHLVVHTRQANLSSLLRHLNGVYTQAFNRRHGKVGHVFQGRFKAILVDRDAYLLALCRYVELNPVAARLVPSPEAWAWSSYAAHVGAAATPAWLDSEGLHGYLLGHLPRDATERTRAAAKYASLVKADAERLAPSSASPQALATDDSRPTTTSIWAKGLRQQVYLGDEAFVARMQALAEPTRLLSRETPRVQRQRAAALSSWLADAATREEGLYRAHTQGGMSMTRIARELGLSVSRVSRLIARHEAGAS